MTKTSSCPTSLYFVSFYFILFIFKLKKVVSIITHAVQTGIKFTSVYAIQIIIAERISARL